jgi:hypothetical protein
LIGREIAMREAGTNQPAGKGYNTEFGNWLTNAGLADMHPTERSDLFAVLENLSSIEAWRQTLTRHERLSLNHPRSVLRKWKAREKAKAIPAEDKPSSAFEKMKRTNVELQEELHRIKKHGDGNAFSKDDTAKNVALAVIGTFEARPGRVSKVESIARELLTWVKTQKPAGTGKLSPAGLPPSKAPTWKGSSTNATATVDAGRYHISAMLSGDLDINKRAGFDVRFTRAEGKTEHLGSARTFEQAKTLAAKHWRKAAG